MQEAATSKVQRRWTLLPSSRGQSLATRTHLALQHVSRGAAAGQHRRATCQAIVDSKPARSVPNDGGRAKIHRVETQIEGQGTQRCHRMSATANDGPWFCHHLCQCDAAVSGAALGDAAVGVVAAGAAAVQQNRGSRQRLKTHAHTTAVFCLRGLCTRCCGLLGQALLAVASFRALRHPPLPTYPPSKPWCWPAEYAAAPPPPRRAAASHAGSERGL